RSVVIGLQHNGALEASVLIRRDANARDGRPAYPYFGADDAATIAKISLREFLLEIAADGGEILWQLLGSRLRRDQVGLPAIVEAAHRDGERFVAVGVAERLKGADAVLAVRRQHELGGR